MEIKIFDVEHGACALVTADTGARMLIDCGHNSTTGWRPSTYLLDRAITTIERLIITNYDEDHVSDIRNLLELIDVRILRRNQTVSPQQILQLKSETGVGPAIQYLTATLQNNFRYPIYDEPNFGTMALSSFHNNFPQDFDDENNLSLVNFLHCHNLHIVFPGDIEVIGWQRLLERQEFRAELARVNVFVASHHGRDSGCCKEIFDYCKPQIVVMSDKATMHDTQKTAGWYGALVPGIQHRGQLRKVFTTRYDGTITFTATPNQTLIATE